MLVLVLVLLSGLVLLTKKILPIIEHKQIFEPTKIDPANYEYMLNTNLVEKNLPVNGSHINIIYLKNPYINKWIIFAHGNSGCIYDRLDVFETLGQFVNIVTFDYHGYGKSGGVIANEQDFYRSIIAVYDYVVNKLNVDPKNITLYGESLGCSAVSKCAQIVGQKGDKL